MSNDTDTEGRLSALERDTANLRKQLGDVDAKIETATARHSNSLVEQLPDMIGAVMRKLGFTSAAAPAPAGRPKLAKPAIVKDAPPCPKHPDAPQTANGCTFVDKETGKGCTFAPKQAAAVEKYPQRQPEQEA